MHVIGWMHLYVCMFAYPVAFYVPARLNKQDAVRRTPTPYAVRRTPRRTPYISLDVAPFIHSSSSVGSRRTRIVVDVAVRAETPTPTLLEITPYASSYAVR